MDLMRSIDIRTVEGFYTLALYREDLPTLFPGMTRYTLCIQSAGQTLSLFRTNSYEYSPRLSLEAEKVVLDKADEWESELKTNPHDFIEYLKRQQRPVCMPDIFVTDVVVIQGSPRPDGNCSILAEWSAEIAHDLGYTAQVLFPAEMQIRQCIGCYQCYNTGTCTFDDDMAGVIHAVRESSLLVICSPVYTNTVPGGLKILIDRCQAYHAERSLTGGSPGPLGLLFSVAGRKGQSNFRCVSGVMDAFMRNIGIEPAGEIFFDGLDELRDVRKIFGIEEKVRTAVRSSLSKNPK
jgi:multimeric flavodoxin WrbA